MWPVKKVMKFWLKEIEHSFNKSKKSKNKTIYKVNISQPRNRRLRGVFDLHRITDRTAERKIPAVPASAGCRKLPDERLYHHLRPDFPGT